ncbi:bud emergence protein 1 [Rhizopus stolonifer]|uniref:Bud emergence protein 1 n=1 Tax=Rhizopus stolonifer TaxID=4846 RepID=A0A367KNC6_RHIST|nr:bud emergence protein 1 [Rhizopus stolonifer]
MFLPKEKVKPPRSLRSARLSVVKNQISTPVIQTSVTAPKKVIKALYDYQAQSPHELSFLRGDFFLVSSGTEKDSSFYEAFNPITNSRGNVPVQYFQVLEKHEKAMVESAKTNPEPPQSEVHHKAQPLYGIVLYDFKAERSDELDAKAGEPIIIIAQSNSEWYVAKPIGRLGGPGLIPISFVDIRDASTGRTVKNELPQSFPNVEDWKKKTLGYEASSIEIGRQLQEMSIQERAEEEAEEDPVDYYQSKDEALVVSAYIDSYILEGDQYWFIVFARLSNQKHRVLYRLYEDFYDFQINFLQEYPMEAGKQDQERILPFMPGPLDAVNDEITADRARDLSKYCDELLKLPRYLSSSTWVQDQLFGIHEGDIETDIDPATGNIPTTTSTPNTINTSNPNNYSTTPTTPTTPVMPPTPLTPATPATPATPSVYHGNTIKVKIKYKDEIFAIKVPVPITVEFLRAKIIDRIGFEVQLFYKNGDPLVNLETEAFESAVKIGKLTVLAS